jgi:hypothetical protein
VSRRSEFQEWKPHETVTILRAVKEVLGGGHYAAIVDFAARKALAAWDAAVESGGGDELVAELHDAMQQLRDVIPLPPQDYDPRPYIASQRWVFAKSMPENPHYYVLLSRSSDWRGHLTMLAWIRRWGRRELFGRWWQAVDVDGWHYWAMSPDDTILNRKELK